MRILDNKIYRDMTAEEEAQLKPFPDEPEATTEDYSDQLERFGVDV